MNAQYPNMFKNLTRSSITVILLDGRKQIMAYDKTTKLSQLFEATCDLCYIDKDDLFGFAVLIDDYFAFLDLNTKVSKVNFKDFYKKSQNNVLFKPQCPYSPVHGAATAAATLSGEPRPRPGSQIGFSRGHQSSMQRSNHSTQSAPAFGSSSDPTITAVVEPTIHFRVRCYIEPRFLGRAARSLYCQQLLRNVLQYRLHCPDELYLQMGVAAIQAHYGDCPPQQERPPPPEQPKAGASYFEVSKFFPGWLVTKYGTAWLEREVPMLHSGLAGLGRVEAEMQLVRLASQLPVAGFNMHLFPVRRHSIGGGGDNGGWLGLSPSGLRMHQMTGDGFLVPVSTLKWADIDHITNKNSAGRIQVYVGGRVLKLHTSGRLQADHLFWLIRHMHLNQARASFSATQSSHTLDNTERHKYREKYIYMDSEDKRLHEEKEEPEQTLLSSAGSGRMSTQGRWMPASSTPAAPPRRMPSRARPKKMKELMRESAVPPPEPVPVDDEGDRAGSVGRRPQYIKKRAQHSIGSSGGGGSLSRLIASKTRDSPSREDALLPALLNGHEQNHNDDDNDDDMTSFTSSGELVWPPAATASHQLPTEPPRGRFVSLTNVEPPPTCGDTDTGSCSSALASLESHNGHHDAASLSSGSLRSIDDDDRRRQQQETCANRQISSSLSSVTSHNSDRGQQHDEASGHQQEQRAISNLVLSLHKSASADSVGGDLNRSYSLIMGLCREFPHQEEQDCESTSGADAALRVWRSDVVLHLDRWQNHAAMLPNTDVLDEDDSSTDNEHESVEISSLSDCDASQLVRSIGDPGGSSVAMGHRSRVVASTMV